MEDQQLAQSRAQCKALFLSLSLFFFFSFPAFEARGARAWPLQRVKAFFARTDNPFDALMRLSFIAVESSPVAFHFLLVAAHDDTVLILSGRRRLSARNMQSVLRLIRCQI